MCSVEVVCRAALAVAEDTDHRTSGAIVCAAGMEDIKLVMVVVSVLKETGTLLSARWRGAQLRAAVLFVTPVLPVFASMVVLVVAGVVAVRHGTLLQTSLHAAVVSGFDFIFRVGIPLEHTHTCTQRCRARAPARMGSVTLVHHIIAIAVPVIGRCTLIWTPRDRATVRTCCLLIHARVLGTVAIIEEHLTGFLTPSCRAYALAAGVLLSAVVLEELVHRSVLAHVIHISAHLPAVSYLTPHETTPLGCVRACVCAFSIRGKNLMQFGCGAGRDEIGEEGIVTHALVHLTQILGAFVAAVGSGARVVAAVKCGSTVVNARVPVIRHGAHALTALERACMRTHLARTQAPNPI